MKINTDFSKILDKEMEEKWVALSKDQTKVVDFSGSLLELRDRLGKTKNEYTYMKVLRSDVEYAFVFLNVHD